MPSIPGAVAGTSPILRPTCLPATAQTATPLDTVSLSCAALMLVWVLSLPMSLQFFARDASTQRGSSPTLPPRWLTKADGGSWPSARRGLRSELLRLLTIQLLQPRRLVRRRPLPREALLRRPRPPLGCRPRYLHHPSASSAAPVSPMAPSVVWENWVLGLGVCLLGIESEPGQELFARISNHATAGDLVETWSLSLWLQGHRSLCERLSAFFLQVHEAVQDLPPRLWAALNTTWRLSWTAFVGIMQAWVAEPKDRPALTMEPHQDKPDMASAGSSIRARSLHVVDGPCLGSRAAVFAEDALFHRFSYPTVNLYAPLPPGAGRSAGSFRRPQTNNQSRHTWSLL